MRDAGDGLRGGDAPALLSAPHDVDADAGPLRERLLRQRQRSTPGPETGRTEGGHVCNLDYAQTHCQECHLVSRPVAPYYALVHTPDAPLIGQRIRAARTRRGLTQKALARRLDEFKDTNDISRWENGRHTPDLENLVKLAIALSVSSDYLLGLVDFNDDDSVPDQADPDPPGGSGGTGELRGDPEVLSEALEQHRRGRRSTRRRPS